MEYWQVPRPSEADANEAPTVHVHSIDQAGVSLRRALAAGPGIRVIRLLLNPTSEGLAPWLDAARAASPEVRGLMAQAFFARIFSRAGYRVVVGSQIDIFARGRFRSLLVEVKSSLKGGKFGSNAEVSQLDGYLVASQRSGAERWLGTMGIDRPMELRDSFRDKVRFGNIGHLDLRWVSPQCTLTRFSQYVRMTPPDEEKKSAVSSMASGSSKSAFRSPASPSSDPGSHSLLTS